MNEYLKGFAETYGDADGARVFFAPGRVNLIGEHTDYNGGHVFPCALSQGTIAVVRPRTDGKMRFFSANFTSAGIIEADIAALKPGVGRGWTAYPCGVVWALIERGSAVGGFDMWVSGNIPNGAGLSSSASLEVVTGYALNALYSLGIDNKTLAIIGQKAENAYVGLNCGIMDQFAVAMGRENCAIFLDTATLDYAYAPLKLDGCAILIMDTCKKRGLRDSKYNERRAECEKAYELLKKHENAPSLCAVSLETLEKCRDELGDLLYRRARHAVTEERRTVDACAALAAGDIAAFGKLMNASHLSLETDYEVTGNELDSLAHNAWTCEGVIGARMTGAGFGGCAVAIVREDALDAVKAQVEKSYTAETGLTPKFYIALPGDGPREVK